MSVSTSAFLRILDDTKDNSQPNSADSASENRHRPRNSTIMQTSEPSENGTISYQRYIAGPTTIAPNRTFIARSSAMRLARMTDGGMGIASKRSLSFAS